MNIAGKFATASNVNERHKSLTTMKKIKTYIKESYNELVHKVSWPTWSQLQSSAIVVMIGSVVLALVVLVMDLAFKNGMSFIYEMLY
jgi:preprotein translocase subunit SecE